MRVSRRIAAFLLLTILCTMLLAIPASATHMVHEGLDVTIVMDKEVYDHAEPITAAITVKNTNNATVTITNLEQLIPEGYKLAEDSLASMKNINLAAGQSIVLEVTFVEAAAETEAVENEDFFGKILYGESFGIPNILIALIAVIAIAVFMWLT